MPDVVLLDIMLPSKDGWQILAELKNKVKTKKIPIIMVSVLNEKNLAYEMKADEYLIKPVEQEQLVECIFATMNRKNGIEVLVADDDENFLKMMRQFLRDEAISFRLARDGIEALELIKKKKPDLVILDLMMPRKDGFGVIEEIKKENEWADITIIVVTAKDLSEEEKAELTDRAKLVIQKSGAHIEDTMHMVLKRIKEKTNDQKSNDH